MNGNAPPVSLDIRDWSVTYAGGGRQVHAVKNCSLSVARGKIVGLVGESGSGKSTLLMSVPKLLPAGAVTSGRIFCAGQEISCLGEEEINRWRWRRVALIPQGAMNSFTPHLTIERHIYEVLECHLGIPRQDRAEKAAELAAMAELERDALYRYPHELSGGQKQRAALALALACAPDFLLADEPTTALDVITQKDVLETIASLVRERGMGLLLVTHDLPLAAAASDSLVVMKDGEFVEQGPSREVSHSPRHPYTRKLVAAIMDMDGERR
ncbi:MAG: ABC transporter ATP-binding protein [Synergistaceae bacterium]|jgi:ABC-type glutathione transport system ATPase component|nr:ABC transporter ATP-binding protein [Synergistaceae bacterium]